MPIRNPPADRSNTLPSETIPSSTLPSSTRAARLFRGSATTLGLAVVTAVLASGRVSCAFASVFHVPCPGCGSTRATLALVQGDWHGVLHNNPFGPVMALLLFVLGSQAIASSFTGGSVAGAGDGWLGKLATRGLFAVVALELVLWISRFFGAFGGPVSV